MTTPAESGGETRGSERAERESGRDPPRIYVACLSAYNNGRLHGAWIDAAQEPDDLGQAIAAMLAASPMPDAEEWALHDFENFGPLRLGEYESLERISQLGLGIEQHGEPFAAYAGLVDDDADLLDAFEDHYLGRWDSFTDYAETLLDDLGASTAVDALPDWLQPYVTVDAAGYGRDLELSGDVLHAPASDGSVHVFAVSRE